MKKVAIFDLDGTLAESKQGVTREMIETLTRLSYRMHVVIISGGPWYQFETQILREQKQLSSTSDDNPTTPLIKSTRLILLPTSGSQMYRYELGNGWYKVYGEDFTLREKRRIYNAWFEAVLACDDDQIKDIVCCPTQEWGEIAEDRGSQITFSMLGQKAPLDLKKEWDPDGRKRKEIIKKMYLPECEIRIGGTTSIDVTKKGIDKAYGIKKLLDMCDWSIEETVFVGDALFPGGNDYPAKEMGIECFETSGPKQTLEIIESIIEASNSSQHPQSQ